MTLHPHLTIDTIHRPEVESIYISSMAVSNLIMSVAVSSSLDINNGFNFRWILEGGLLKENRSLKELTQVMIHEGTGPMSRKAQLNQ